MFGISRFAAAATPALKSLIPQNTQKMTKIAQRGLFDFFLPLPSEFIPPSPQKSVTSPPKITTMSAPSISSELLEKSAVIQKKENLAHSKILSLYKHQNEYEEDLASFASQPQLENISEKSVEATPANILKEPAIAQPLPQAEVPQQLHIAPATTSSSEKPESTETPKPLPQRVDEAVQKMKRAAKIVISLAAAILVMEIYDVVRTKNLEQLAIANNAVHPDMKSEPDLKETQKKSATNIEPVGELGETLIEQNKSCFSKKNLAVLAISIPAGIFIAYTTTTFGKVNELAQFDYKIISTIVKAHITVGQAIYANRNHIVEAVKVTGNTVKQFFSDISRDIFTK